jgi:hypothetical protein
MCALFGGSRDISFIRHINKELINNIEQNGCVIILFF